MIIEASRVRVFVQTSGCAHSWSYRRVAQGTTYRLYHPLHQAEKMRWYSFVTMYNKRLVSLLFLVLAGVIILRVRGCGAFHFSRGVCHRPRLSSLRLSNSKFPGIMAAEISSPSMTSAGFEPLTWLDEYDMNGERQCCTAVLPDDELPFDIDTPPSMHNKRTLFYCPSLLSIDEASSLQKAANYYGNFIESNRIAGIIEDGICVSESLASVLNPILNTKILPWAREVSSTPTLTVADALIRTYDPSEECLHLLEHYDESAYATIIIPLNDPTEYEGGLYVQSGASSDTRRHVPFNTMGDCVLHKYDVMHGVHVRSGKERCSLVIWFGEDEESVKSKSVPWVRREAKTSVHAAFLFAFNSQHGLLGFEQDLEVAKQYYSWASQRGHALSEYKLWLIEEEGTKQHNNEQ